MNRAFGPSETVLEHPTKEASLEVCSLDPRLADDILQHVSKLKMLVKPLLKSRGPQGTVSIARRDFNLYCDEVPTYTINRTPFMTTGLTKELAELIALVNAQYDENYNCVVVNRYNNGKDYIGPHHDGVEGLGRHGVVTISLGVTRVFQIKYANDEIACRLKTSHGMSVLMKDAFQTHFVHEILADESITETRFSLTFRSLKAVE